MATDHVLGLLLGIEDDWPATFEALMRRLPTSFRHRGADHRIAVERITIEPFDLRSTPRYGLVVDRLGWWYNLPREWLKKVALMDGVYLLNNPFTFQAMEKHSAYCALMRLGLRVPTTWMVPHKQPPDDNPRFAGTAERYNLAFDLEAVGERVGYPLYMKPFDGGAWVGVTRVANAAELHAAYDGSGERLMHMQASVEGYNVFVRSLSVGAETTCMRYDPGRPLHDRYTVDHGFLDEKTGDEAVTTSRMVNALFRWELNSCEMLVRDGIVYPIDYANASPDLALTSLHYYFPWAIAALVRWSIFCLVTGRRMQVDQDLARWMRVADDPSLDHDGRLTAYRRLADRHFDVERYRAFVDRHLPMVDGVMAELVLSPEFDDILVRTVLSTFPPHEHEKFITHYRGLLHAWAHERLAA